MMMIRKKDNEENVGKFYGNELQKKNQTEFRIEKVITKKGHKLHFKLRGFDNSCINWTETKGIIIKNVSLSRTK